MKIGVVIDGSDTFVRDLIADWQSHYQVEIFTFRNFRSPPFPGRLNMLIKTLTLKRFLNSHEVVFFEWAGPLLILASKLKTKSRIITRLHSWELFEFAPEVNWEAVERIVLVGEAMLRWFRMQYPMAAGKVAVINNGISVARFSAAYEDHGGVIGMLGSVLPIKRVYEAVLAFYELKSLGYDFKFLVGGPAPQKGADDLRYYAALKHLIHKLGLDEDVVLCGRIKNAEEFLRKVDIFISNSYWESQHVALVEAMSSGCYCLGHGWDGIEDILPEGQIFYSNSELIAKIRDYWGKTGEEKYRERKALHDAARARFDLEAIKPKMRKLFEN